MTRALLAPGYWTRTQFWAVATALFLAQVGLIWTFAARGPRTSLANIPDFAVRLLGRSLDQGQLATSLFAEDPTLFQAPAQNGFSGRAWMSTPSPEYHGAEASAPDVSLSLGAGVWKQRPLPAPAPHETPLTIKVPEAVDAEPDPVFATSGAPLKQSAMRLDGALARRRVISRQGPLPAQSAAQLLSDSIVQMAVNPAGEVMSVRLVGASGSAAADAIALNVARRLRFVPDATPRAAVAWGNAVFSWQTIESVPGGN